VHHQWSLHGGSLSIRGTRLCRMASETYAFSAPLFWFSFFSLSVDLRVLN
jgi:hypothetical protein